MVYLSDKWKAYNSLGSVEWKNKTVVLEDHNFSRGLIPGTTNLQQGSNRETIIFPLFDRPSSISGNGFCFFENPSPKERLKGPEVAISTIPYTPRTSLVT